jgi:hypothetical protein
MTAMTNRALAVALLLICAHLAPAAAPPPARQKSPDRLAKAWADLASEDEAVASRALLALAASPKESVALLKARLAPVKIDRARFEKLLELLDDDEFEVREAASRELEYLGRFAKPLLLKALEGKPRPEVRKRIATLLTRIPPDEKEKKEKAPALQGRNVQVRSNNDKIEILIDGKKLDLEAAIKPVVYPTNVGWLRAVRAVALLESVGTPESVAVLKKMAAGEKGARPTDEAAAALSRLRKR